MITIALTGSIGMGKSTAATMFAEAGAFVWDADEAVHRLYAAGGTGARAIEALAPGAVVAGAVDRTALRAAVLGDPAMLKRVEAAIHPLVAADRLAALARASDEGFAVAVCDIPLLYETGGDAFFDHVAVVSAPADMQRERVLARPGMTEAAYAVIRDNQLDDAEKRRRADFVIDTGRGFDFTREAITQIMRRLAGETSDA